MKALCAFKWLRKTDLSRATHGSAKTAMLVNLADSSPVDHFSTSCVSKLDFTVKENSCLLQPESCFYSFGYCFYVNLHSPQELVSSENDDSITKINQKRITSSQMIGLKQDVDNSIFLQCFSSNHFLIIIIMMIDESKVDTNLGLPDCETSP